jgi:transcriptional regulator with XRE-family HTH domain
MSTAEAIATLRQKLKDKQTTFAERLGVTLTSVSRYENGREPSRQVLKKLADVAAAEKLNDLRDIFTAKWKASITARLKSLRSAGTERSVPLDDLKRWHAAPQFIREKLLEAMEIYRSITVKPSDQQRLVNANRLVSAIIHNFLPQVSNSLELYINIPTVPGSLKSTTKGQHK